MHLIFTDFLLLSGPTTQWCLPGFSSLVTDGQCVGRYFEFMEKILAWINYFYDGCQMILCGHHSIHIYQVTFYSRKECSCLCGVFIYLQILTTTHDFLCYPTVYKIPTVVILMFKISPFLANRSPLKLGSLSCWHFITQHFLTFWPKKMF